MNMVPDEASRSFYRIVATGPPSVRDFLSNAELGKTLNYDTPEARRLWGGISVYDSRRRARQRARNTPELGAYIAEVRVQLDGSVRFERTGRGQEHYTLWADANVLLAHVVAVFASDEPTVPGSRT